VRRGFGVANLIVSTWCNQAPAHATAGSRQRRDGVPPDVVLPWRFLPLDSFQNRLDFLARSGVDEVRLVGGEPALHPDFVALVARALDSARRLVVFTTTQMSPAALSRLVALPVERCRVVVDVDAPAAGQEEGVTLRTEELLGRLGRRAAIRFTIQRTDFAPDLMLRLVTRTGCEPIVQMSMVHPSLSGTGRHISPGQYRVIAARLVPFVKKAADAGVRTVFDCGFVRCMFSPDELSDMRAADADCRWHCGPGLDITADDTVFHCAPLSTLAAVPFEPWGDAATLRAELQQHTHPYRRAGVYRECSTCIYKAAGECSGGCLSATIRRFRHTPFRVEIADLAASHPPAGADLATGYREPAPRGHCEQSTTGGAHA